MGLDMYLEGKVYYDGLTEEQMRSQPICQVFRLNYWRKHPDLHGYIIRQFANEIDGYKEILLGESHMLQIIEAIRNNDLPYTTGVFLGESTNSHEQKVIDIDAFTRAIGWSRIPEKNTERLIYYRAIW